MLSIGLVKLGYLPKDINFKKLKAHKSAVFNIIGDIHESQLPNTTNDYDYSTYTKSDLEKNIPEPEAGINIVFAITNCGLEHNFYASRVSDCKVVMSLRNISTYLENNQIPLENAILKMLYACALGLNEEDKGFIYSLHHDETRCCLFDMNGNIEDIVFSSNEPKLCISCQAKLLEHGTSKDLIEKVNKELKKLKKPLFYRMTSWIKKHPIWSIIISSIYAVILNIIASYIFKLVLK